MANNFIGINLGTRLGSSLMSGSQNLNWSIDVLTSLKAAMDNMVAGADYSIVEAQFGIPAGKGQILYNLVAGAVADMNASANITQLLGFLAICRP